MYLMAGGSSWNHVVLGDSLNPSRVRIYNLSTNQLMIHNHATVYAVIVSPNAVLNITNHGELFGRFVGLATTFGNHAKLHIDGGSAQLICNQAVNDTVGAAGATSGGGITSAADFLKWFSDVPGTNASLAYTIDLVRNASGIYEYLNDAFLPIDHQIYGNEGQAHNYYFTYVVDLFFAHDACASPAKFVEFRGADDCWIFVNDDLGIDLGGVVPLTKQRLDVDRLNLNDGQVYALRIFYAQRNSSVAQFHLWTNLDLLGSAEPSMVTSAFD